MRPSSTWLSDAGNANALLDMMDKPEYYGDDQQEHMLTALSRITYHMKRQKGETWREFFTRWEGAMRKVHHHHINLPSDYEGFLMINGLQLSEPDTRAMLNFTRGCIKPASIKEWLRKNETKLAASELGSERNKTNKVFYAEEVTENDFYQETADDSDKEIEILESYLTDLQPGEEIKNDEVLEEEDAAEILATIIKQKKTYKESMREKKERELSRGYGLPSRGSKGGGKGQGFMKPGQYKVSIEEIKRRTRCNNCGVVGHWKRECPMPAKSSSGKVNDTHHLETFAETNEAVFLGKLELQPAEADLSDREVGLSQTFEFCVEDRDRLSLLEAYKAEPRPESNGNVFELFMFENWLCSSVTKQYTDDATCATVDTGCQRLAIGSNTLRRYAMKLPEPLQVTLHPEINRFKSVHNVSTTSKVATVPSSLGSKGTFLRPAVFEEPASQQAPFLISLTFLMHCNSTLGLDEENGLFLKFRDSQICIPLHLGPSNALRVPLQLFEPIKIEKLRQVQGRLQEGREFEILVLNQNFCSRTGETSTPTTSVAACHGIAAKEGQVYHRGPGEAGCMEPHGAQVDGLGDPHQSVDGAGTSPPSRQPQEDDGNTGGKDGDGGPDLRARVDRHPDPQAPSLSGSSRCGGFFPPDGSG